MENKIVIKDLNQNNARKIIELVGGQGTPPEFGFQYFTAGLEPYLETLENEYISSFIKDGGSTFKMVVGSYGEGKTHFLYCIREIGWEQNYITAYIELSPDQTPFHKLQQVYKTIAASLIYPQKPENLLTNYDKGIETVIKKWYFEKYRLLSKQFSPEEIDTEIYNYVSGIQNYESISFTNAIKETFKALYEKRDDDFSLITQWMIGENPPKNMLKRFKIFEKIDKSTAFKIIRSLVQWIREIGYTGLVVLLDEAEQTPSMSSKQKSTLLNNLRELIDECGHLNFKNTMWFYAVTDESFLEGRTNIYTALNQRLSTRFDDELNPTGTKIILKNIPIDPIKLLKIIGRKLANIYQIAYDVGFKDNNLNETIDNIAQEAFNRKFETGYKRLFVQNIVKAFHKLKKSDKPVLPEEIDM